jgi:hypothetical protein
MRVSLQTFYLCNYESYAYNAGVVLMFPKVRSNIHILAEKIIDFREGSSQSGFDELIMEVFHFQYHHCMIYRQYIDALRVHPEEIKDPSKVPFLPISFFKSHEVKSGTWESAFIFESSGTTDQIPSRHHVANMEWYHANSRYCFESFYGSLSNFKFFFLLPSYMERSNSSLVAMADYFGKESLGASFYLNQLDDLKKDLDASQSRGVQLILLGVSYALIDFVEKFPDTYPDLIVMETGGMKGRREELIKPELHELLINGFGVSTIHSEYGMTELFSQAYSKSAGLFFPGKLMKVLPRNLSDPLSPGEISSHAGINIIDLSNLMTCSFIATDDIGRVNHDGSFEILGRQDFSDIRGCNLLIA